MRRVFAPLFLCALALPCLCFAQDQDQISDSFDRTLPVSEFDLPETDTVPDGRSLKVYPLAAYMPGTGLVAAGYLSYNGLFSESDKFEMYGASTFGPQRAFYMNYSDKSFLGTSLQFQTWAAYANFEKRYYGRGNETSLDDRQTYLPGSTEYGVALARDLGSHFTIEAAFVNRSWDLTALDPESTLPDASGGMNRFLRFGIERDTRDDPLEPSRGGRDTLRFSASSPWLGSDFDYSRLDLRLARYRPISDRQVLALRAEFASVLTGEAPFFELPRLGGGSRLRGVSGGRYRADNSVLFGAEWRLRVTEPLSVAFFGEAGKVWDNFDDFGMSGFHATGGVGVRYRISSGFLARFDIGIANDGIKPIAGFGQAF